MAEAPRERFLSRWSRLKAEPRSPESPPDAPAGPHHCEPMPGPATDPPPQTAGTTAGKADERRDPTKDLPPLEGLTPESDYSMFMREGVPEQLRRKALRKLWVSDPVLNAPDIFDVYCGDYHQDPVFPEGVKTLFRVGWGMVDPAAEAQAQAAAGDAPERLAAATPTAATEPGAGESSPREDGEGASATGNARPSAERGDAEGHAEAIESPRDDSAAKR